MVVITNLPPPTYGIRHEQPATSVVINKRELGKGTLYIAESHLSWVHGNSGLGFSLEYAHISVHAVSRDERAYPEECLYLLMDSNIDFASSEQQTNESDDDEEDDENNFTELRFIPEDKSCLDAMFTAMSDCQVLHPGSEDSFSEDEDNNENSGEGDEDYDFGESPAERSNGAPDLEMEVDEGQFEDAEE